MASAPKPPVEETPPPPPPAPEPKPIPPGGNEPDTLPPSVVGTDQDPQRGKKGKE